MSKVINIPAVYKDNTICNFIVYRDKSINRWILEYKDDEYIKTLEKTFNDSIAIINLVLENYGMITRLNYNIRD